MIPPAVSISTGLLNPYRPMLAASTLTCSSECVRAFRA